MISLVPTPVQIRSSLFVTHLDKVRTFFKGIKNFWHSLQARSRLDGFLFFLSLTTLTNPFMLFVFMWEHVNKEQISFESDKHILVSQSTSKKKKKIN